MLEDKKSYFCILNSNLLDHCSDKVQYGLSLNMGDTFMYYFIQLVHRIPSSGKSVDPDQMNSQNLDLQYFQSNQKKCGYIWTQYGKG